MVVAALQFSNDQKRRYPATTIERTRSAAKSRIFLGGCSNWWAPGIRLKRRSSQTLICQPLTEVRATGDFEGLNSALPGSDYFVFNWNRYYRWRSYVKNAETRGILAKDQHLRPSFLAPLSFLAIPMTYDMRLYLHHCILDYWSVLLMRPRRFNANRLHQTKPISLGHAIRLHLLIWGHRGGNMHWISLRWFIFSCQPAHFMWQAWLLRLLYLYKSPTVHHSMLSITWT